MFLLRNCGTAELQSRLYRVCIAFDILSISMYSNELRNCGTAELQSRLYQVCIAFDILSIIIYSLFEFYKITKWKNLLIQSFNNTINTVWFNVDEKYNTKNYNMIRCRFNENKRAIITKKYNMVYKNYYFIQCL